MIRVYGYYCCSGYKDLYLGNSEDSNNPTHFLPMLPVMKHRNLPEEKEKILELEQLPQIHQVTADESYDFPAECRIMFSHGGYHIIYRTLSNGDACLAIHDIPNNQQDEFGRDTPFNLLFIATHDVQNDVLLLDRFAIALKNEYQKYITLCSTLFSYDFKSNGVKFDLPRLFEALNNTNKLDKEIVHNANSVVYLMLYTGSSKDVEIALREQNFIEEQVHSMITPDGKFFRGNIPWGNMIIIDDGDDKDDGDGSHNDEEETKGNNDRDKTQEKDIIYVHNTLKQFISDFKEVRNKSLLWTDFYQKYKLEIQLLCVGLVLGLGIGFLLGICF